MSAMRRLFRDGKSLLRARMQARGHLPTLAGGRYLEAKSCTRNQSGLCTQISVCSESSKASSTSMPRYLTVHSSLV
jgi:hypothetical protein